MESCGIVGLLYSICNVVCNSPYSVSFFTKIIVRHHFFIHYSLTLLKFL